MEPSVKITEREDLAFLPHAEQLERQVGGRPPISSRNSVPPLTNEDPAAG
jgi:hypothetical protein